MDDDWDDTTPVAAPPMSSGVACEGGRKFSAGRGFKAVAVDDDTWGNGNSTPKNDFADSGWNDAPSDSYNNNRDHRGGGRGRGGRGGGRGGGFRGDRNRNQDDDSWGGGGGRDESNGDEGYGGGRSGGYDGERRGRGGGRRGGRGGFGGDDEDGGRRGGRGGSRGGFRGGDRNGDGDGHEENGEEKKREIYVPVERTNDEELFTSTITSGINFVKLDDIEVNVSGEDAPPPINTFDGSGLRPYLLTNVKKSGYNKPTPIQKYAIPIIMKGRDLMACAQTGSGKTAAFLLPMINTLLANQEPPVVEGNCAQPRVVIVSPTRELAIQIFEQAKKFAYDSIVKTVVAYGGTSVNHQRDKVISGCHILVATPGRLNDFVKRGHVSFGSVQYFVLDEADRMLDLGFLPCVEQMLGDASMTATGERQTLMFSATFPEEVQHLAGKFLHNYLFVTVGIVGSASTDVQQIFIQISKFDKRNKLLNILNECKEKTVVFVETKRNADFLATFLSENDIPTTSIHGDRLQREREQALWDFKKGIRNILVATGVAARGLDIQGIEHVINYDLPKSIDEYVHRIGRTGRVGNRGKATSFFDSSHDSNLAGSLAKILKQAGQEVPDWLSSGGFDGGARDAFGGRDIRGDDYGRAQDFIAQPAEENDEAW